MPEYKVHLKEILEHDVYVVADNKDKAVEVALDLRSDKTICGCCWVQVECAEVVGHGKANDPRIAER